MSGYGFLGAMKGIGEAGKNFGEALMEDEFEERRQQRIEERQIEREKRAAAEYDRQRSAAVTERFGKDYNPDEGTFIAEKRKSAEFELGDAYDPEKGAYGSKLGVDWDDWLAKQEFGNDEWDRRLAAETGAAYQRAKNSESAKGTWKLAFDDSKGWHETNSVSGQTRTISAGAGAKDGSGVSGSGAKVATTDLNHGYNAIAKQFGGTYEDGILKSIPPEAKDQVLAAYDVFTRLVYEGVETGRATFVALDTASRMVSEEDARAQAMQEAKDQNIRGGSNRREFVERRTQELREEGLAGISSVREQTDAARERRTRGLLDPGTSEEPGETFKANDGSTITMAEIEATAAAHGQTPEQVIENLRARGILAGD